MRIRWKAVVPLLGVIGSWMASPDVLALVGEKASRWMLIISSLIAVITPALLTNRPRTDTVKLRTDKRLEKAGLVQSPKDTKPTVAHTRKLPDSDRQ